MCSGPKKYLVAKEQRWSPGASSSARWPGCGVRHPLSQAVLQTRGGGPGLLDPEAAGPGPPEGEQRQQGQAGWPSLLFPVASRGKMQSAPPGPGQGAPRIELPASSAIKPFGKLLLQVAEGGAVAINQN